jgi:hypothetical protein
MANQWNKLPALKILEIKNQSRLDGSIP